MTNGELMKMITKYVKDYSKSSIESVKRNRHMNNLKKML